LANWSGGRLSRRAVWSHYLARFSVPVLLITALAHRFQLIDTPTALTLLALVWAGAALALILGLSAMRTIWRLGIAGTGRAFAAVVTAIPILAFPAFYAALLLRTPALNDVTTDPADPPLLVSAIGLREPSARSVVYPGEKAAAIQNEAYPDLGPLRLALPTPDAYQAALETANDQGWRIVATQSPGNDGGTGRIEAVAMTLLMAFRDDVAIRITPTETGSRVDIRSASRYGSRDFGANASRIRRFLLALRERAAPTAGGEK
jgi:hypothetical protein